MDISMTGAKIMAPMPSQVADRFQLTLTQTGGQLRGCEVVWRRAKVIGVRFTGEWHEPS
ncbi:PilZ domain-containing protein [Bradyrhizobium sp. AUGA SZCCT0182]|nr:PilZ domain-containing protein [Bradyrhizobium sp. AUGA SZCCT0182]